MFRFFFSTLSFFLFFNGLNAQTENAPTSRPTTQQLSPTDANLQKETNEVEGFARKLASLKTAFAEKDASRIIACEAYLLSAMRQEADQMAAKATLAAETLAKEGKPDPATPAPTPTRIRLGKMTHTLAAFERHAFDPAQPEAAARDFAQLDEFLKMMQEELGK